MYSSLKNYTDNTLRPLRDTLTDKKYAGQCDPSRRGIGMDCLFSTFRRYDVDAMKKQRKKIYCTVYDPDKPYMFEFTPLASVYPYDPEYTWVDTEDNPDANYLDVFPSYDSLDDKTRAFFHQHVVSSPHQT